jgi:hemerythrin
MILKYSRNAVIHERPIPAQTACAPGRREDELRYVRWHSGFETGDHEVDEQHRTLHYMVNDLNARALIGEDQTVVAAALERIMRHAVSHFESEEALMMRSAYPKTQEHVAVHQAFSDNVANLLEAQRAGVGPSVTEVAQFLDAWFMTHIRSDDQQLIEYVRGVRRE